MVKRVLRAIGRCMRLHWLTGPILEKELRVASRKRRHYLLRLAYPLVFAVVLAVVWLGEAPGIEEHPAYLTASLADFGRTLAMAIVIFQFIALHLLAVVLLSTTLGDEVRRRTLGVLLTTPVTSLQIVGGKLASRLWQVALFMAISTPFLVLVRVFGGVPWEFVTAGILVTFSSVLSIASATMLLSMLCRRMHMVVVGALLAYMGYSLLVPAMLLELQPDLTRWHVAFFSPPFALTPICSELLNPGSTPRFPWGLHCGIVCGLSLLVFGVCVSLVRRAARAQAIGAGRARGGEEHYERSSVAAAGIHVRHVRGSPVFWREIRQPFIPSRGARRAMAVLFVILVLVYYAIFLEEFEDGRTHGLYLAFLAILGMLAAAALGASAITSEKEAGTWPALLGTLQSDARIVIGKLAGCLGQSLSVWFFVALHLFLFTAAGLVNPLVPPIIGIVVAGVAFLITAVGLWASAVFRKTTTAVVVTVLAALVLWAGIPGVLSVLAEFKSASPVLNFVNESCRHFNPLTQIVRVADEGCGIPLRDEETAYAPFDVSVPVIVYTAVYHIVLGICFLCLAAQRIRRTPWARRRA